MSQFSSLGLSEMVLRGVRAAGYDSPTPIQLAAIPIVCAGRDLIACAQTGTGKTAAFVLPLLDHLGATAPQSRRAIRALVVTPTRELALQVESSVRAYGKHTGLRSVTLYGGVGMEPQIRAVQQGADIVVATPGRLLDLVSRGNVDLSRVEVLILDEADRMFDMGFLPDVRRIVAAVPKKRQTLLFSATMPQAIQDLARTVLQNPEFVEIGQRRNPAESVSQHACGVTQDAKVDLLLHLLRTEPVGHVIIFSRTKHRADRIAKKLNQASLPATVLHSNRTQNQRQRALDGLRTGQFRILVATDLAARGIDVAGVTHVFNFDVPNVPEDYIHRIGRTGRAQAIGDSITFVAPEEEPLLRDIERHTGKKIARMHVEGFVAPEPVIQRPAPARPSAQHAGRPDARQRNRSRTSYGR